MFYLKAKNGEKVEFEGEFFTECVRCGKELTIDPLDDKEFDAYGTACYCSKECLEGSRNRIKQLEAMHEVMKQAKDESIYLAWVSQLNPDDSGQEPFQFTAENDELYEQAVNLFKMLVAKEEFKI